MLDWRSRKKASAQRSSTRPTSRWSRLDWRRTASPTRKNHWKVPPRRNFFKVAKSTLTECFVLAIWQVMIDHYHTRTNFIKNMNAPGSNKTTKRDDNMMRAYSSRDDRYAASKNLLLVDAQIPPPREKQVCFQTAPRG